MVLVDFDGTVTEVDADIFVASHLLEKRQYHKLMALYRAYESTHIGLLEYFYGYLSLVDINSGAFTACLHEVPIRRDVVALVASLIPKVPVTIVSEGLDVYIHPILKELGLTDVPVICNRIFRECGAVTISSDPSAESCDRCLSCKGAFVTREKQRYPNRKVAVIGNGASDLCAAKEADTVFARDSLAHCCDNLRIPYIPWSTARDIENEKVWAEITGSALSNC